MNTEDTEQDVVDLLSFGCCTGYHCKGSGIARRDHTCPYSEKISNNSETLCNCCDICVRECAMDI